MVFTRLAGQYFILFFIFKYGYDLQNLWIYFLFLIIKY